MVDMGRDISRDIRPKDEKGRLHGTVIEHWENSHIVWYEGEWEHGEENGISNYYYKSGALEQTGRLRNGEPIGLWEYFVEGGSRKFLQYYII